jgi:hypothetical protein
MGYRRWSIRVPRLLFAHVKGVAQKERWAVSDLVRMLIVLGAAIGWLKLRKQENLDRLGEIAHVGRMADMLTDAVSHNSYSEMGQGTLTPTCRYMCATVCDNAVLHHD